MSRTRSIPFFVWVLTFSWLAIQGRADAQCDTPVLSVRVDSIFARNTGAIDKRLGPEGIRLQGLFEYRSYQLLRTDEADTPCGEDTRFFLAGDRVLHVTPLATHGNSVALDLALFAGARAMMRTQLKLSRGGLLLLVGSHDPQEAYITTLTIDAPGAWSAGGPLGDANAVATPSPSGEEPIRAKDHH